jgi:hypothetical protein
MHLPIAQGLAAVWTQHRPAALYFVEQPDLRATFLTINAHDRWGFLIHPPSSSPSVASLLRQRVQPVTFEVRQCGVQFHLLPDRWRSMTFGTG